MRFLDGRLFRLVIYGEFMAYAYTPRLVYPIKNFKPNSFRFGQICKYKNTLGVSILWGRHLGADVNTRAGTQVVSIGRGRVAYSALHPGLSKGKRNWGNIIIIAHKHQRTKGVFFSVYGHLEKRLAQKGDGVGCGQPIGRVAKKLTQANGWWEEAHLHFGIYIGPWQGKVLPGYFKTGNKRTKMEWWKDPVKFIEGYAGF